MTVKLQQVAGTFWQTTSPRVRAQISSCTSSSRALLDHSRRERRTRVPGASADKSSAVVDKTDKTNNSSSSSADDLLQVANALLAELGEDATVPQRPKASTQDFAEPPPGMKIHCDVNGCSIVKISKDEEASLGPSGSSVAAMADNGGGAPRDFEMAEGDGWRLGFDRAPRNGEEFSALVGGSNWSIELSQREYADFIKLLHNLRRSVTTLQTCGEWGRGADEGDDASLELSTDRVWMQGRAPQRRLSLLQDMWNRRMNNGNSLDAAFALRFIILTPGQREVEGQWSAEAVMDVLHHLEAEKEDSKLKSTRDNFANSEAYA